ncbi:MAG: ATP-dependent zinc metalloprotease FtsH [Alphaproteobacteria bacterium]|nr:ATP-dependent zinc metalloprotease FtsH [Alphaproteobacteria bacterium]
MIGLMVIGAVNMLEKSQNAAEKNGALAYSEFIADADSGKISNITISGERIKGNFTDGKSFVVYVPEGTDVVSRMEGKGIRIQAEPDRSGQPSIWSALITWLPMLLIIFLIMRQIQGSSGKAMSFGKSKAKLLNEKGGRVTFEDVAGVDEAKEELVEVVEFLRDPHKFQRLGGKIPKGCLLVGPPGTGKTLLARSVAGEAGVPFFTISGSDFVEMFVGVGASRVRDMFEQGKKNAPCIIFIDEIDAVGRHRGAGLGGGNDEREQTLNQLLVEMDGFEANEGVILIAATNRPDVLDPALLRPGRFDRQVVVPNPDVAGREQILKVHMRKVPLAQDVDARIIARGTPGFSGADMANLVNEAALLAARRDKRVVGMQELEDAKDKVMMGAERRSMAMTEDEKKLTAYHEAGHAIVALHEKASDPIHKATIIPRGRARGMVMRLPEGDRYSLTREKLHADLAVAMGGRIAEEMIFGRDRVTTGASSDIKMATDMARRMVTEWGLSDEMGPIHYGEGRDEVFLGYSMGQGKSISGATQAKVDTEVKRIVEEAYQSAQKTLTDHKDELHALAKALLEYETLSGDEIPIVIKGDKLDRDPDKDAMAEAKKRQRSGSVPTAGGADFGSPEPEAQDTQDSATPNPPPQE